MQCGQKLPDGAKFCFACGSPVQNSSQNSSDRLNKKDETISKNFQSVSEKYEKMKNDIMQNYSIRNKQAFEKDIALGMDPETARLVDKYTGISNETVPQEITSIEDDQQLNANTGKGGHKIYYNFPCTYELYGRGEWLKQPFNNPSLVQEDGEYLYYVRNKKDKIEFHRISLYDNESEKTIAAFEREQSWVGSGLGYSDDCFHLGMLPCFCVQNGRIYFSVTQINGPEKSADQILSMDVLNCKDTQFEFQLTKDKNRFLCNPYVIGNSVLARAMTAYGPETIYYLDDKSEDKLFIKFQNDVANRYLAINDECFIVRGEKRVQEYNLITQERVPISKAYPGAKDKKILFIDAQKDILYYQKEDDDRFGEIIGISKSGEVVDEWKAIKDPEFKKYAEAAKRGGYSSFSFDGNLRIYRLDSQFRGTDKKVNIIYAVDREGNCDVRFFHDYTNEELTLITSELCIQTRNAVIVCLYSKIGGKNGGYPLREYMITTTGPKICKPLFQELE